MLLRIRDTGELLTGDQFASLNPNTTLAQPFIQEHADAVGADIVVEVAAPQPGEFERVFDDGAELFEGRWVQRYRVERWSDAEIAEHNAELRRQLVGAIVASTQRRLDDFARTRNCDGILSACTYATSTVPKFAAEGQYCVAQRDATWATLYTILAEVEAGTRPVPSGYADIEQDLPALTWPA